MIEVPEPPQDLVLGPDDWHDIKIFSPPQFGNDVLVGSWDAPGCRMGAARWVAGLAAARGIDSRSKGHPWPTHWRPAPAPPPRPPLG